MGHRNINSCKPQGSDSRTQKLPHTPDTAPTQVISATRHRAIFSRNAPHPAAPPNNAANRTTQPSSAISHETSQTPQTQAAKVSHTPETSSTGRMAAMHPSHIRQTRPSTWTMLQHIFALLLCIAALIASIWFFVMTPLGQRLDETAYTEYSYHFLTVQPQSLTILDQIPAAAGTFATVGLIFVLVWKHRFVPALVGLGVALAANATTQILKNVVIYKPDFGIQEASLNSAPSGHTTFAAASVSLLFLASPKRLRPTVAVIGMFFTLAAGYSTVVNGWHRPSDVITAILVTTCWSVIGLAFLRFLRSEELDMGNTQRAGMVMLPLLLIAGFFLGFCAIALYLLAYSETMSGSALLAASSLIASVACITTASLIGLLRSQNKQRKAYTKVWTY